MEVIEIIHGFEPVGVGAKDLAECLLIRKVGPKPFIFLQRYGYMILLVLVFTRVLTGIMSGITGAITNGLMSFYAAIFGVF